MSLNKCSNVLNKMFYLFIHWLNIYMRQGNKKSSLTFRSDSNSNNFFPPSLSFYLINSLCSGSTNRLCSRSSYPAVDDDDH